jgi:hypothetical protein
MADFGSGQGGSEFETGGVAKATLRISNSRERRHGTKDAIPKRPFKEGDDAR